MKPEFSIAEISPTDRVNKTIEDYGRLVVVHQLQLQQTTWKVSEIGLDGYDVWTKKGLIDISMLLLLSLSDNSHAY